MRERALTIQWFSAWHPILDEALAELPDQVTCPNELSKLLVTNRATGERPVALVSEGPEPVAIIGLRRRQRHWEPVVQGVTRRAKPPAKPGYLLEAMAALRKDVRLSGWEAPPPPGPAIWHPNWPRSAPVYQADLTSDFTEHWRQTDYERAVRTAQRRCDTYEFAVDRPGAAEWVIGTWARRWRGEAAQETVVADEVRLAVRYFEERGRVHSFVLLDGGTPIAGEIDYVEGDVLISRIATFDQSYAWHRPGTHLLARVFHWGAENGYRLIDLGGFHEYKSWAAPQSGEEWSFGVSPRWIQLIKGRVHRLRHSLNEIRAMPKQRFAVPLGRDRQIATK